jgi:hypothetical protein
MQIIKSFFKFLIFILPLHSMAQSTFLPQGSREYNYIDRTEILNGNLSDVLFTGIKPFSRKKVIQQMSPSDSNKTELLLAYPEQEAIFKNNIEWIGTKEMYYKSQHPVLKNFYTTPCNFYSVNTKDFFLSINPVLSFRAGKEMGYDKTLYLNTRGITLRGKIANKIGFSSTIVDNQERGPEFFQQQVRQLRAVPGVGFYKIFKKDSSANDYFDGRGYVTFNATKYIDFQFGYDKNFIGDGYRSLFLSDWSNSYLFAKINTTIWKFNYQNIFMELTPQFRKEGDSLLKRKYAAMHHLSFNATKWLNIGLFEGVMFGRKDHFEFQYLNPIIFYRHIESTIGSPDNALAGIDFKANVKKRFQVYGQLLLDEFILSKIKNDPSNWVNKFGMQLGGKYINAFGVKNLDVQVEMNRVRPFTYSHNDTINNYTHYNQPLAHPLGANFMECIGIVRYQPFPKLVMNARMMYYYKGLDSTGKNFGGNIFRSYNTRVGENGYRIGFGDKLTCINAMINVSYELRQNLFFDLSYQFRNQKVASLKSNDNSNAIQFGMRLNMWQRQYDF